MSFIHCSVCWCLKAACVKESGSTMWVYVFLGNALRGIGESPVTPLGISYIDDFAKAENSPFYIGTSLSLLFTVHFDVFHVLLL